MPDDDKNNPFDDTTELRVLNDVRSALENVEREHERIATDLGRWRSRYETLAEGLREGAVVLSFGKGGKLKKAEGPLEERLGCGADEVVSGFDDLAGEQTASAVRAAVKKVAGGGAESEVVAGTIRGADGESHSCDFHALPVLDEESKTRSIAVVVRVGGVISDGTDAAAVAEELEAANNARDDAVRQLEEVSGARDDAARRLEEAKSARDDAVRQLEEAGKAADAAESRAIAAEAELEAAKRELEEAKEHSSGNEEMRAELDAARAAAAAAGRELEETREQAELAQRRAEDTAADALQVRAELEQARAEIGEARRDADEARAKLAESEGAPAETAAPEPTEIELEASETSDIGGEDEIPELSVPDVILPDAPDEPEALEAPELDAIVIDEIILDEDPAAEELAAKDPLAEEPGAEEVAAGDAAAGDAAAFDEPVPEDPDAVETPDPRSYFKQWATEEDLPAADAEPDPSEVETDEVPLLADEIDDVVPDPVADLMDDDADDYDPDATVETASSEPFDPDATLEMDPVTLGEADDETVAAGESSEPEDESRTADDADLPRALNLDEILQRTQSTAGADDENAAIAEAIEETVDMSLPDFLDDSGSEDGVAAGEEEDDEEDLDPAIADDVEAARQLAKQVAGKDAEDVDAAISKAEELSGEFDAAIESAEELTGEFADALIELSGDLAAAIEKRSDTGEEAGDPEPEVVASDGPADEPEDIIVMDEFDDEPEGMIVLDEFDDEPGDEPAEEPDDEPAEEPSEEPTDEPEDAAADEPEDAAAEDEPDTPEEEPEEEAEEQVAAATDGPDDEAPATTGFPGLDTAAGVSEVAGNEELYRSLLVKFRRDYVSAPEKIGTAIEKGNVEVAHLLLHAVKGVAGVLGAAAVRDNAEALESALMSADSAAAQQSLAAFSESLAMVIDSINRIEAGEALDTGPAPGEIEAHISDPKVLRTYLEGLRQHLHAEKLKQCQLVIREISARTWPRELNDAVNRLAEQVRAGRFEEAREEFDALMGQLG